MNIVLVEIEFTEFLFLGSDIGQVLENSVFVAADCGECFVDGSEPCLFVLVFVFDSSLCNFFLKGLALADKLFIVEIDEFH